MIRKRYSLHCHWSEKSLDNVVISYSKSKYGIKESYKVIDFIKSVPTERCNIYVYFYNFFGWRLDFSTSISLDSGDLVNINAGKSLPAYIYLLDNIKYV